ncbi:hypothetical protein C4D60_Mb05t15020 [Musa balbisiana]|uniref:Transposase (putative) gypsy type domain-containing protein n=1 Tax=Musa balbisiana TaxID=52838 RepID=A0A4S8JW94_MUSBA|nr:hypothetical protein C4D60_Mb05t15020 [Musa balbisiana]
MTSSSSSSSSSPNEVRARPVSPSSERSSDGEATRALEALMWPHDLDSTVSGSSLRRLRECYSIPEDYILSAPELGQRAYNLIPKGFALTLDALEAGLRLPLPLHPVIVSCLSLWRISLSQVVPNSWRYLVAFLGECHYANITPTRNLFLSCFHLSKGSRGYFLSARTGFRVSGAPSSNKGWKGRDWGFEVRWSARVIDNTVPSLSDREHRDLGRLREILPRSQSVQNMTEWWLIKAGLNLMPQGMVNLLSVRGGRASSTSSPRPSVDTQPRLEGAPLEVEVGRPPKKVKITASEGVEAVPVQPRAVVARRADRGGVDLLRGAVGPSREVTKKGPRPPVVHDLC